MNGSPSDLTEYAVQPARSRGRDHPEPPDPLRSGFELDRYRVVHCTAFRRLEYKTQVFVTHEGDHYRTRLTHTLEVAHMASELARALDVNAALAEVVALAHDLGHTPFGHAGESALAERMRDRGGFEHNRQSLRIVEYLEHPYPPFRGLNLLPETRECLASHATPYDHPNASDNEAGPRRMPPIEGQVTNIADRLAYGGHDLEDALGAGLITETDLADLRMWTEAAGPIRRAHPNVSILAIRRPVIDTLIRRVLMDILDESRRRLGELDPRSPDDVRTAGRVLVGPSAATAGDLAALESFLLDRVYRHPRVAEMDAQARQLVGEIFDAFMVDPSLLPPRYIARLDDQGIHTVVCDYIAGMTDRFVQAEHDRLTNQIR